MTPFETFIIFGSSIMGLLILLVAWGIGMSAKIEGTRPRGSVRIIDYSPLEYNQDPVLMFVKYHPTTLHYATPLKDSPNAHGLAQIVVMEGLYGMRRRVRTIQLSSFQFPKNIKGGYGSYRAELFDQSLQERVDRLEHEKSDLQLRLSEAEQNYESLSRNVEEAKRAGKEEYIKDLRSLQPMMPVKRTTGGGGR